MEVLRFIISLFGFFFLLTPLYSSIKDKAEEMVAQVVADPPKFFYELKNDSEITLPVPSGKSYNFNISLFPTLLPLTYANTSINYNLYKEGKTSASMPQIDLFGGVAYMFGAKIAANMSDDIDDANFWGYHLGFLLTSSVNSKTRMFYGFKHSFLYTELKLSPNKKHELLGVEIKDFDSSFLENSVLFGVETLKDIDKRWAIEINYGLKNNTLAGKISWYGKWFELGFNIYPEGVIVIHPTWIMRLSF